MPILRKTRCSLLIPCKEIPQAQDPREAVVHEHLLNGLVYNSGFGITTQSKQDPN